jgi:hypothetical protein
MNKTFAVEFRYGTVDGRHVKTITKHAVASAPVKAIREARKLVHPLLIHGRDTLTITSAFVTPVKS